MFIAVFGYGLVLISAGVLGQIDPRRNSYGQKLAPVLSLGGLGICLESLALFYKIDAEIISITRNVSFLLSFLWGLASLPGMIGDIRIGLRREALRKEGEFNQEPKS